MTDTPRWTNEQAANWVEASCMHSHNRPDNLSCKDADEDLCGYCQCAVMLRQAADWAEKETAWLLERHPIDGDSIFPWYWGDCYWTPNPFRAIRFVRRQDAEVAILMAEIPATAVQHRFVLGGDASVMS